MSLELIKYNKNIFTGNTESFVLGEAHIEVKGKMKLWFKILKSKKGMAYCVPVSTKIEESWVPSFELSNAGTHKKLCHDVLELLLSLGKIDL